ncbi:bifunctional deaminase-reductase domain protein [Beutenbergia cavernae DSM 12333]|uniref:Bifunctional deaminase-reductase domain protein n=1 Tax=Beutenbergia cavernae (strain ATCC BAA-8 / DSM 12333 / CCUG 43141 / JCM 11478 / NBRC 16432 / NCIMB 13614 / HKI 0122) TaxID=471853 RepID=C5BX34_BEUC1|nr:dihydrofolate reductase family protein [Beutenbergia cavernae]ACQ78709.1 bifunctional deaminase-reductase domain protein [Beutenbergia cavernae DSM 12333]
MSTRKIVVGQFVSLDGVVESPQTWHFPYLNDEMGAALGQLYAEADTLLLGRATYEEFAAVWPHQTGAMADAINGVRKVVVSTTLVDPDWQNTTVVAHDVLREVARLKESPGRDIAVTGSITLTQALLAAGLVDELRLLVHPIVLGAGRRLFADGGAFADGEAPGRGATRVPLALASSTTFATGVLDLTYRPA